MSIKEIAQRTGLSTATVSHALNATRGVSAESKKLVLQVAKEMGYKPSLAAQMLRTQKSNIVALVIPSSHPTNETNTFYFGLLNGAKSKFAEQGYEMIVSTYAEQEKKIRFESLGILQSKLIDGMLLVPNTSQQDKLSYLHQLDIPVVLVDRTLEQASFPTVTSDNYGAAEGLVKLLVAGGAKRIAFLGGSTDYSTVQQRLRGYKDTLHALGRPIIPALILTECRDTVSDGYTAMAQLWEQQADAVFTENSMLLLGVIQYCQEHAITIPTELSVAGFDNAPWMAITYPTITAVQQNPYDMGRRAASLLINLVEGIPLEQSEHILPTDSILRQSHNKHMASY